MVLVSGLFAVLIGLPLGTLLLITAKDGLKPNSGFYACISTVVNIGRSIPFAILIVAIIPFTRLIVGTSIGTTATIVPLTIAAAPFFARLVESAFKEVDPNIVRTTALMGSTNWQIISKVLIPESLQSLVRGVTLMLNNLINYSAMAGLVGGGGLGKIAIQYGYQRFNGTLMLITLIVLLLLVEIVQWLGNGFEYAINRKRGLL